MIKNTHFYWLIVAIYSTIHSKIIMEHLELTVPSYPLFLFFSTVCFVFSKYINSAAVPAKINALLWLIQSLVLLINIQSVFIYWNSLYLVIFLLIEVVRFMVDGRIITLKQQIEYYEDEMKQYNELFQSIRSERHDFLKHISAVHFMLEKEGSSNAKTYLDELVEGYEETNLSIKGENGAVASILHRVHKQAILGDIELKYDFDVPLSTLPMKEKDIVSLVGNLLFNSLEATQEWGQKHKKKPSITIRLSKRSGLYLLTCKNDCLPIPATILDSMFKKFGQSTKTGKERGYGTKIIQTIVNKYHGYLDYTYKEESFTVKLKIPVIKNSKAD